MHDHFRLELGQPHYKIEVKKQIHIVYLHTINDESIYKKIAMNIFVRASYQGCGQHRVWVIIVIEINHYDLIKYTSICFATYMIQIREYSKPS